MEEETRNKLKNGCTLTMKESSEVYNYILELENIIIENNFLLLTTLLDMNENSKDSDKYISVSKLLHKVLKKI